MKLTRAPTHHPPLPSHPSPRSLNRTHSCDTSIPPSLHVAFLFTGSHPSIHHTSTLPSTFFSFGQLPSIYINDTHRKRPQNNKNTMPVILLKGERASNSKYDPRLHSDIASLPCPLFSGHLLKLGLSGQWQSRLFTFDGSGKKKRSIRDRQIMWAIMGRRARD